MGGGVDSQCHTLVPLLIVQEAEWAPGPVWMGVESLASTGTWSQTIWPVVSFYSSYAIQALLYMFCWLLKSVTCHNSVFAVYNWPGISPSPKVEKNCLPT